MSKSEVLVQQWGVPNALIRSATFSTKRMNNDRQMVKNKQISSQSNYTILYSGEELNQYDCQILWAILHIQKVSEVSIGSEVNCFQLRVLELIEATPCGANYEIMNNSLKRLTECLISIQYTVKTRKVFYHGHIIDSFKRDDRGHLTFRLNGDISKMFQDDCTIVLLKRKLALKKQLSKWLFDFASSHSKFIPMSITYLMEITGSDGSKAEFVRTLKLSCNEIISVLGKDAPFVEYKVNSSYLNLYKHKQKEQAVLILDEQFIDPFEEIRNANCKIVRK